MAHCPECGAPAIDHDLACPACGHHPCDDVVVLDLDAEDGHGWAPGLDRGVYEERFADLGAGLGTVPRRVHGARPRDRPVAPVLAVIVALLVLSALATRPREAPAPTASGVAPLRERTRTELLLLGRPAATILDVDRRRTRPANLGLLPAGDPTALVARDGGFVVLLGGAAYGLRFAPTTPPVPLGRATLALAAASPGRAWLLGYPDPGVTEAREVDLDGTTTAGPVRLPGSSVLAALGGGRFVAQPPDAAGHTTLEIVGPTATDPPRLLARDALLVAARSDLVAYRRTGCSRCPVMLADPATGRRHRLRGVSADATAYGGTFSPDGRTLAVFESAPGTPRVRVEMVDLYSGSTRSAALGAFVPPGPAALAWSPSGAWLFFDDGAGRLEAVNRDGTRRQVDAPLPRFDGLVTIR